MGIGYLKLDRSYITPEHPAGQWIDEPENSALRFQFDPANVKFSINTKWKESDTANEMDIPWKHDHDGDAEPTKIMMTLMFDDRISALEVFPGPTQDRPGTVGVESSVVQWSAQRSAEILEAWATPIVQPTVQRLLAPYEKEFKFGPPRGAVDWPEGSINMFAMSTGVTVGKVYKGGSSDIYREDPVKRAERQAADSRELMGVQTTTVGGLRMTAGSWHAPRPLLLSLFTGDPMKCVMTELELDIVAIDTDSGNPFSIAAHVTFEEWPDYDIGNHLLEEADPKKTLEEYKTIDAWTKAVQSGEVKQTLAPRWEIKTDAKGPVTVSRWRYSGTGG